MTTETRIAEPPHHLGPDDAEARGALVRLFLVIAGAVLAAVATGVAKTVLVVFAILVMIVLHEFGHFITAKAAGMKVTEFFVGFGPRLWSIKRGETEYGVKALPLGGYCKIPGMTNLEQIAPEDEPRTYRQKPFWRRLSVAVAGSTMHFIIALVLIWATLVFVGAPQLQSRIDSVSGLTTGPSPAQIAGFQKGDKVQAYDGHPFQKWDDFRAYIGDHAGQTMTVEVARGTETKTLQVTPIDRNTIQVEGGTQPPKSSTPVGFVGITPAVDNIPVGAGAAVAKSGADLKDVTILTFKALGSIFSAQGISDYGHQLTGRPLDHTGTGQGRFSSPVGVVRLASQAADKGLGPVLMLLISINVFVGIFNMIPLLPLDGGHVAIAVYERIRSRRGRRYHVDAAKLLPITYAAVLFIVFLGLTSLFLDLAHPAANPFQ